VNRVALWILVSAIAAVFFGLQTYRSCTGPVLPAMVPPVGETFSPPAASPPRGAPGNASDFGSGFSSVIARPVFRPDRRPHQRESGTAPGRNYEAELARYTLLGVLMTGDEKKAVVVSKSGGQDERWEVGAGDRLADFTVKEVGEEGLILAADGKKFTLPLYAGGPKSVGRAPLRTEVAPAPSAAQPKPRPTATPTPGARMVPPSATAPPSTPTQVPTRAPTRIQQRRTYPRRYLPGRR
jgi:hypothetical protein